jgi:hypothetical protein
MIKAPVDHRRKFSKKKFFADVKYVPHVGQDMIHGAIERAVFTIIACGARFGKTKAAAHEMAFESILPRKKEPKNPDGEFMGWCVAPTHDLADIVFDMTHAILCSFLGKSNVNKNQTEGVITITNLGGSRSRIMRKSTDNVAGKARLVGYAVDFMVLDEASGILEDETWENMLRTRLIDREGRALLISTPRGTRGFFAAMHRNAKHTEGHIAIQLPSWVNPHVPKAVFARERATMPGRAFDQEYGAKFVAAGGLVFGPEFLEQCATVTEFEQPTPTRNGASVMGDYVGGLDLGMSHDATVLTIARGPRGSETQAKVVYVERFPHMPVPAMISHAQTILARYGDAPCKVDETGLGKPIVDAMRNEGMNVRGVMFSATSKRSMVNNAATLIERNHIAIPDQFFQPIYFEELSIYGWKELPSGYLTTEAPPGAHDDCVASFLLVCDWFPAGGTMGTGRSYHAGTARREESKIPLSTKQKARQPLSATGAADPNYYKGQRAFTGGEAAKRSRSWTHPMFGGRL